MAAYKPLVSPAGRGRSSLVLHRLWIDFIWVRQLPALLTHFFQAAPTWWLRFSWTPDWLRGGGGGGQRGSGTMIQSTSTLELGEMDCENDLDEGHLPIKSLLCQFDTFFSTDGHFIRLDRGKKILLEPHWSPLLHEETRCLVDRSASIPHGYHEEPGSRSRSRSSSRRYKPPLLSWFFGRCPAGTSLWEDRVEPQRAGSTFSRTLITWVAALGYSFFGWGLETLRSWAAGLEWGKKTWQHC